MRRNIRLALAVVVCLAMSTTMAEAGLKRDAIKATMIEFNTSYRSVRADFLEFPSYSLHLGGHVYACQIPTSLRRLGQEGELFRVRKVKVKRDHFLIELETPGKTRLKVRVLDQGKLRQEFLDAGTRQFLQDVFEFGPPPQAAPFVGHQESHLLHSGRCNHLPTKDLRVEFETHAQALAAGFRDCPICFANETVLPYPNYREYRLRGLQAARTFELVYPLSQDQELQDRLDQLGDTVLAHWPLELSGFEYDFRVVQSQQPLAISFATGIVIVSDTMIKSADAEEELLFVLAHEIAYCELVLPPRSPFPYQPISASLDRKYVSYTNWSGSRQRVADLMALSWFDCAPPGQWNVDRARVALAKVQYANGWADQAETEGAHVEDLHQRLALFDPKRFVIGDVHRVFAGVDGEGDIRYEVRYLGMAKDIDARKTRLYLLLTTTDYQEKAKFVGRPGPMGIIRDGTGHKDDFTVGYYKAAPGTSVLVIGTPEFGDYFEKHGQAPMAVESLSGLSGVKDWVLSTADQD